jgi:hypothetical protein
MKSYISKKFPPDTRTIDQKGESRLTRLKD